MSSPASVSFPFQAADDSACVPPGKGLSPGASRHDATLIYMQYMHAVPNCNIQWGTSDCEHIVRRHAATAWDGSGGGGGLLVTRKDRMGSSDAGRFDRVRSDLVCKIFTSTTDFIRCNFFELEIVSVRDDR
jgi:hypothetical protein